MDRGYHDVHEAVRGHYGAIAQKAGTGQSTCCSSSQDTAGCSCAPTLYDDLLLKGLPADVTGLSLGCGDPITIAGLKPGETVLDLGSGGGIDCFLAWRQVGPDGHIIGIDMTPAMLAKANANKEKLGATNVEFRQGQIETLPVESNCIDVVMSNCVINLSPDKPAVFREIARVLKPGGRMSISDIVTEGDFSPEMREQLDQWAECVTGAIDVEQYTHLIREAGFVDIQVIDKVDAEDIIERRVGMPRVFSARITARQPI
ncbi:MAG: arsenite methyltransferase [Anaerolineae bacterium]|nr:arsenite methyltransferase [Anaerolineae bacterium]